VDIIGYKNMVNANSRINPYMIGRPIHEPEKFFGRESLFQFIEDNLRQNINFILLHGQRRIGKSSVLQQFSQKVVREEFVFFTFDLQEHRDSSLGDILHNLAEQLAFGLGFDSSIVTLPSHEELNNNPDIFADEFMTEIYQELGGKSLVLLLDEFDVVSNGNNHNHIVNKGAGLFPYLKSLLRKQKKLFIIPVVGRSFDDMDNLLQLFKGAPFQEVGLLDDLSARRLITKPAIGVLGYEEDAIKAILELSAGHPYFTQVICFNLFVKANNESNLTVTRSDVLGIVEKAIESANGGLAWFWDGLSIPQKVVFSAVAEAQKIAQANNQLVPEEPLKLLKKYGVIQTELLIKAAKQLVDKGYLDDIERRVKIELVRCWLVQCHPLNQEIYELDKLEKEEINILLEQAKQLYIAGKKQDTIDCYEEILKLNPNHFSTLPILADKYLEIENFETAIELYQRAYQVDNQRYKEGLLSTRETYGKNLIVKKEFIKAKVQFEGVLEIEPDRKSAKEQLKKIEAELQEQRIPQIAPSTTAYQQESKIQAVARTNPKNQIRRLTVLALSTITTGAIAIAGVVGFYRLSTPCSEGQEKVNGNCLPTSDYLSSRIPANISRGDRTLFFTIPNTFRDQGIKAFKAGNYSQAADLFQKAVTDNRNDPEVLIYYNNAKAREKGNSLSLAIVIPAESLQNIAQEMLRGVAQAQNKFNTNGGSNGRLLEIVIANDSDNPDKAKKIAQQLVSDKSILGVIGHYSSDATQSALDVYKLAGIPIISPTSTANTLNGDVFFRTVPSDTASGETLAQYAKNSLLNKAVIFYNPKSTYSNSLREEFKNKFTNKFTGQIVRNIDLTGPTLDIEKELETIASQQVQAVMLFPNQAYAKLSLDIAKANISKNLGLKLFAGSSLYDNTTLELAGNVFEGLILAVPWFRDAPKSQKFASDAAKQWGGGISWRTATSFDATQAFIKTLSSNSSRVTVLEELRKINLSSKETSGDELTFSQLGERQSKAILVKVEKGQFRCLQCSL
jgi:ABC-type branched-subunit amino acid transport system substrate-binding protein